MGDSGKTGKKSLHIEVIRILAILLIMYIHTGFRGQEAYTCTDSRPTVVLSLVFACLSAIGVTLFWMVSGSLLLGKKEDAALVYKKRLPKKVLVLFIFSVIRYFYEWLVALGFIHGAGGELAERGHRFGLWDFLRHFLSGSIFEPYWFLYFYIGILLALPFLRRAVQGVTYAEWKYFAILEVFFLIIVRVIELAPKTIVSVPFYVPEAVNAFILGYAAEKVVSEKWLKKRGVVTGLGLSSIAMVAIECVLTITLGNLSGPHKEVFIDWLIQPLSFCLILFIRGVALRMNAKNEKECAGQGAADQEMRPVWLTRFIYFAGSCSFGIYLIEDYLRNGLAFIDDALSGTITLMPACVIWLICCYILGLFIVGLIKKIPWFGKLI